MTYAITQPKRTAPYIRMAARAAGSASVRHACNHVAVVETDGKTMPTIISRRALGVKRIVWDSGAVYVGTTERTAYARAVRRAEE
jgi:hypothetical protein